MTASISDRMKGYERPFDPHLTPNSPVVIRVDGKSFHTLLRHATKPFDRRMMHAMRMAMAGTTAEMHGFKLAYTQSDECTFVVTDYDTHETESWFGYSLSKIVSITASTFTGYFNEHYDEPVVAVFDARAYVVPVQDVPNVFVWRQRDWERNSVQMLARAHFSHKECMHKKLADLHEMLHGKGINWSNLEPAEKNGSYYTRDQTFVHEKLGYDEIALLLAPKQEEEAVA
jgi:tRNA(His) 5'-end guanylyltransferase